MEQRFTCDSTAGTLDAGNLTLHVQSAKSKEREEKKR